MGKQETDWEVTLLHTVEALFNDPFFAYFPKVGLCDSILSMYPPPIDFQMLNQSL
jgi:hypothetical protein